MQCPFLRYKLQDTGVYLKLENTKDKVQILNIKLQDTSGKLQNSNFKIRVRISIFVPPYR